MHLWLIGMMGSGKTTVGRIVAERLGLPFVDTDAEVSRRLGCSIAELWGTRGENAFRDIEAAVVDALAAGPDAVIATGGGVVLRDDNVDRMRATGHVVWLSGAPATLAARLAGETAIRPLLADRDPADRLAEILDLREARYRTASHAIVETGARTPDEVAASVMDELDD